MLMAPKKKQKPVRNVTMLLRNFTNLKFHLSALGILLLLTATLPAVAHAGWTLSAATRNRVATLV